MLAKPKKAEDIGELGIIKLIERVLAPTGAQEIIGVGDDTAVLPPPKRPLVFTTDMLIQDVHFKLDWMSPSEVGYKSIVVNASDVAAMAGEPTFALVSLSLRPEMPVSWIVEFYRGALEACERYGIGIVGGDTNKGDRFIVNISLLGEVEPELLRRRSDASPGEIILVTAPLGASAAGLRLLETPQLALKVAEAESLFVAHKRPAARVREARIASRLGARAMEDISDGLASDVQHICEASGVGAILFAEKIPIAPGVAAVAALIGGEPLEFALQGGEDYELVMTAPRESIGGLRMGLAEIGVELFEVGEITEDRHVLVERKDRRYLLERPGFVHF